MRIIAVSDTHNEHYKVDIPPGDVFIHCGDFTADGTEKEVFSFCRWLGRLDFKHKIIIAGNHDMLFETKPQVARGYLPKGVIYLENDWEEVDGLVVSGSPMTPKHTSFAFTKQRGEQMRLHWRWIPKHTDVLVTHGPPIGILDTPMKGGNAGCEDLLHKVLEVKPALHLFGHIHEGCGFHQGDHTRFYNSAFLHKNSMKVTVIDL